MKTSHAVVLILVALVVLFYPIWNHNWRWGPRDFNECREEAAWNAKSKEAMFVLISVCRERFLPSKPVFSDLDASEAEFLAAPSPAPAAAPAPRPSSPPSMPRPPRGMSRADQLLSESPVR